MRHRLFALLACAGPVLASLVLWPANASAGEYSAWSTSTEFPAIEYRVKYRLHNTYRAKEGKTAHDWCYEVRHHFPSAATFSFAITEATVDEAPGQGRWGRATLEPDETRESCINFLATPEGGQVRVWIDRVVGPGGAAVPRCDPAQMTFAPVLSKVNGDLMALKILRGDLQVTLSRPTMLELREKRLKQLGTKQAPREPFLVMGKGRNAPAIELSVLAQEFCGPSAPLPPNGADVALAKMRQTLQEQLERATKDVCAKEPNPAKCEERLRQETRTVGAPRG